MTAVRLRYALIFERRADTVPSAEVIVAHQRRLARLAGSGEVAMAGPFEGGGGLVILDVGSHREAEEIAQSDPFVLCGTHGFRLVRWLQDVGPGAASPGPAPVSPADASGG